MKFSCEKNILERAVNVSSRAVSTKTSMQILEGLLFDLTDQLTITGYDLNIGITTTIDVDVSQIGKILINAKLLNDILRKLPDEPIYIETDENLLATIKCGKAIFNLACTLPDEYPEIPQVMLDNKLEIPQNTLKSMISGTIFSVSDNDIKPIHTGCLFECEENNLTVVAVDGYRLSIRREQIENINAKSKFVVPAFALREIEKILEDSDNTIKIYPDKKHILFDVNGVIIITRLLEGEFLEYKTAIPTKSDHSVIINREEMLKSLDRVSLIISERLKNPVRMNFDGDIIKLSCITAIGKSYDECNIEGNIDNLEIGFNNRYISEALRACSDDNIQMNLASALNPVIFAPVEGNKFTYLVLPVRLRENAN